MATTTRITRTVKKLEKPRPLKIPLGQNRNSLVDGRINCVGDIMTLAEEVSTYLCNNEYETNFHLQIINLANNLKAYGQQLEAVYKDQLDRVFVTFRNGSRDENLDYLSRIHLLEMIELRARNWLVNEELNNYYRPKLGGIDFEHLPLPETPTLMSVSPPILGSSMAPMTLQPTLLSPGEIIKTSGKFPKPTKIPGKNYWKDEVVIRNSDSGKVMGIKGRRVHMIEELSETIISFQRVNTGAKERLVQITGPAEEKINYAKQLIEETIRRNASPVRLETIEKDRIGGSSSSLNSSASDESNRNTQGISRNKLLHSFSTNDATSEYKYTVNVGNHTIKITGANLDLVWQAKLVLDEYFAEETERLTSFGMKECDDGDSLSLVGNSQPVVSSRIDGVDSGTTSESDETYKASTDSAGKQRILRQPLNMDVATEILHNIESSEALNVELNQRDSNVQHFYKYTHKELLQFALSEAVKLPPPDWERIKKEFRGVIRKTAETFDPVTYLQKWQEVDVTNLVVSASEMAEMDLMDAES